MEENYKGLLKTYKEFTFLKQADLLRFYIDTFYPNKTIAILYDCKEAIETVPRLSVLKRDNYFAYIKQQRQTLSLFNLTLLQKQKIGFSHLEWILNGRFIKIVNSLEITKEQHNGQRSTINVRM